MGRLDDFLLALCSSRGLVSSSHSQRWEEGGGGGVISCCIWFPARVCFEILSVLRLLTPLQFSWFFRVTSYRLSLHLAAPLNIATTSKLRSLTCNPSHAQGRNLEVTAAANANSAAAQSKETIQKHHARTMLRSCSAESGNGADFSDAHANSTVRGKWPL